MHSSGKISNYFDNILTILFSQYSNHDYCTLLYNYTHSRKIFSNMLIKKISVQFLNAIK